MADEDGTVAARLRAAGAIVEESLPDVDREPLHALFGDLVTTITGIFAPGSTLRDEQRALAWYLEALARRDRFLAGARPSSTVSTPSCPRRR